jgi:Na+/melibiose symporter-like transporter
MRDRHHHSKCRFAHTSRTIFANAPLAGISAVGFNPIAGTQTASALTMLYVMAIGYPAVLGIISAWLVSGHALTKADYEDIHQALADGVWIATEQKS